MAAFDSSFRVANNRTVLYQLGPTLEIGMQLNYLLISVIQPKSKGYTSIYENALAGSDEFSKVSSSAQC